VVEIDLEKVLVTGLSGDHGGVALPFFSRGGNLSGGAATPRCKVQMARGGVNSLFKIIQVSLNNHVSIKDG
jgi:hypothetical protein